MLLAGKVKISTSPGQVLEDKTCKKKAFLITYMQLISESIPELLLKLSGISSSNFHCVLYSWLNGAFLKCQCLKERKKWWIRFLSTVCITDKIHAEETLANWHKKRLKVYYYCF